MKSWLRPWCHSLPLFVTNRTMARRSSNSGLYVCSGGNDILKSTDLQCFIFHTEGLGALFGRLSQPLNTEACLKFIKMRATVFLSFFVEMNFSLTANVKHTIEQRLLRNSHCLWARSDSLYLQFKPTICAQSHPRNRTIRTTPLQERHFSTPLCHAKKQPFY